MTNEKKISEENIEANTSQTEEIKDCIEEDHECDSNESSDNESSQEEVDWQDKYIRLHAEWDNYRKRLDEQRADERIRATERLMSDLLVCVDDMQRTIDYASQHGEGDLLDGVKAVQNKFSELLSQHGLEEIDPKGEQFDPLTSQAIGTVEDDSVYEETVNEVFQKGYKLGIKVLRPAMVTYTTGGEKRPSEDDGDADGDKSDKSEDSVQDGE